jgi:hypothetical protein
MLMRHYQSCKNGTGGKGRIEYTLKLIEYLENRDCVRNPI